MRRCVLEKKTAMTRAQFVELFQVTSKVGE